MPLPAARARRLSGRPEDELYSGASVRPRMTNRHSGGVGVGPLLLAICTFRGALITDAPMCSGAVDFELPIHRKCTDFLHRVLPTLLTLL